MSALLIDIGNSNIKFASVEQTDAPLQIHTTNQPKALAQPISCANTVLLACVGSQSHKDWVQSRCSQYHKPLSIVETQPSRFGVECAYSEYWNMGVDRWLAILAVRAQTDEPAIVVSLGTAVTCDFIVEDKHLGGWIAPGFSLMRDAVTQNTNKVFGNDAFPHSLLVGKGTEECVNHGCVAAMQGVLCKAEQYMAKITVDYRLYISGGAMPMVKESAKDHWHFVENLVLEGLKRFV